MSLHRRAPLLLAFVSLAVACGGSSDDDDLFAPSAGGAGASAGSSAAGSGTAGSGTAGSGTAGSEAAGSGTAGSGAAGSETAGSGTAGSGTAGSGTAGSGTAGSGTAGSGTAGSGTAGKATAGSGGSGPLPTDLVQLAEGLPIPSRIVQRDASLFISARGSLDASSSTGKVLRLAKAGGNPLTLGEGLAQPVAIAIGPDGLYYATSGDGGLTRVAFDGSAKSALGAVTSSNNPVSDMLFIGTTLHWFLVQGQLATPGKQLAMLPQGGGRLATDGARLYMPAGPDNGASLFSVAVAGGPPTTLASGLVRPVGVAVCAGFAYVADTNGDKIVRAATNGSAPASIILPGQAAPWALACDGTSLYWVDHGIADFTQCSPGALFKASLDGTGKQKLADLACPVALAVDATHVFVVSTGDTTASNGAVYRVGK